MDRKYPILIDIGTQIEQNPQKDYVFFYDDGQVYRAFMCDRIHVGNKTVNAYDGIRVIVTIPADTTWRLVHRNSLEFVLGSDMEAVELNNLKQKKDIQKKLIKDLGLDEKEESNEGIEHEWKAGPNPKLYA